MEAARAAKVDDLEAIVELAELALAELTPTRGGLLWSRYQARSSPVDQSIAADLADPDSSVLVATIDDFVLGYSVAHNETFRDGGLLAVLTDIYVEPAARGVGLGEALMDQVLAWAESCGCIGIDSMALPGNRATKNFFERYGLTARAIVVHRSLTPDGGSGQ